MTVEISFTADARYATQVWEIEVPLRSGRVATPGELSAFVDDFHKTHEELFNFSDPSSPIEIVGWRAEVHCRFKDTGGISWRTRMIAGPDAPRGAVTSRRMAGPTFPSAGSRRSPSMNSSLDRRSSKARSPVVVDPGVRLRRDGPSGSLSIAYGGRTVTQENSRKSSLDGVQLAILANRFEGIARKMANTLLRTGRSGVLNIARDFSCCIVTAGAELLATAESLPIHVLARARHDGAVDEGASSGAEARRRLPAQLALSRLHPCRRSHASWCRSSTMRGIHRFTVLAKAHQADCGNSMPTTYIGAAKDVYEEGALIFPAVQVQATTRRSRTSSACAGCASACPTSGGAIIWPCSARRGSASARSWRWREEVGWDTLAAFQHHLVRLFREAHGGRDRRDARRPDHADQHTRPFPGHAGGGHPDQCRRRLSIRERRGSPSTSPDNPDCMPSGLNLSEACARTAAMVGIFNSIDHSVPKNAGTFRRIDIHLARELRGRHPPASDVLLGRDHQCRRSGRQCGPVGIAEIAGASGMAECGAVIPPACGVISGIDPSTGKAFVNQVFLG